MSSVSDLVSSPVADSFSLRCHAASAGVELTRVVAGTVGAHL